MQNLASLNVRFFQFFCGNQACLNVIHQMFHLARCVSRENLEEKKKKSSFFRNSREKNQFYVNLTMFYPPLALYLRPFSKVWVYFTQKKSYLKIGISLISRNSQKSVFVLQYSRKESLYTPFLFRFFPFEAWGNWKLQVWSNPWRGAISKEKCHFSFIAVS